MKRITLFLLLTVLVSSAAQAEVDPIGRVKDVSGTAHVTSNGVRSRAVVGEPVYLHDVIETGNDGSVGVTFLDESRLTLGADTVMTVDEFVYQPEQGKGSFLSRMTRGTVLFVSGLIAKMSPEAAKVETPDGTIGIRGTRFLVRIEERTVS